MANHKYSVTVALPFQVYATDSDTAKAHVNSVIRANNDFFSDLYAPFACDDSENIGVVAVEHCQTVPDAPELTTMQVLFVASDENNGNNLKHHTPESWKTLIRELDHLNIDYRMSSNPMGNGVLYCEAQYDFDEYADACENNE